VSYGVRHCGYDIRIADEFKLFTTSTPPSSVQNSIPIAVDFKGPRRHHSPNSFALGRSVEGTSVFRRCATICVGKSTYARCDIINVTPFEPEWEGFVTLEISNTTPLPARIYANEGIAQVLFFESDEECLTSYKDKKGKYQKQQGITLPRVP
jgi:dCTP deaminase